MSAVDYFLKVDGIDGESKDSVHAGEIDIQSWSWGEANAGTSGIGGGAGAGKVSMQDFHFTMYNNKASPLLFLACATGQHIATAKLTCREAGGGQQEFLTVTFTDLLVSSYQTGGSSDATVIPVDQIAINFGQIEFEYKPQKPDGTLDASVVAGYNVATNAKV
jgi:type VI secretion system secreted protein Hcp